MYKCLSLADYLDVQDLVWDWVLVAELLLTQSLRSELVAATFSLAETSHNQGSGKQNSSHVFCQLLATDRCRSRWGATPRSPPPERAGTRTRPCRGSRRTPASRPLGNT